MDHRSPLKRGTVLAFPGMPCEIGEVIGRGSNAIVYEGSYADAQFPDRRHLVLVKELFPFDPQGHVWRGEDQSVCRDAQGEALYAMHRRSFERGNAVHLELLARQPWQVDGNLNSFAVNGTLYTILDQSGGLSLDRALSQNQCDLQTAIRRVRGLLHALSGFHEKGFLHLDVSPDNILLVGGGELERVVLIDYNSIHTKDELRHGESGMCISMKEGFAAPEVLEENVAQIGEWTDLYAVASVLYTCLTGRAPTMMQLTRRQPPDPCAAGPLKDAASTVKAQLKKIMRRGLSVLPDLRFRTCQEFLEELEELQARIDGVGVTHAALWEAGKRTVQRLIRHNPSLSYVEKSEELYPLRVETEDGARYPAEAFIRAQCGADGASLMIRGEGGVGKSTALLRTVLTAPPTFSPAAPAIMYVPLYGWKHGRGNFILDQVLMELRFDAETRTMEDARHAMVSLLKKSEGRTVLLLLLDGLNEAVGDTAALMEEIRRLSELPGLRIIITSRSVPEGLPFKSVEAVRLNEEDVSQALSARGLLLPESADMRELLRTPMMLSLFIQTAEEQKQQVQCGTADELIERYLSAMCEKAARDAGQEARYQSEVAVRLVLPAIARALNRQGQPLDDQALLPVVTQCRRVFSSKNMTQAFPEWIGHSPEIIGGCDADAWYGRMVQALLWLQLGLLVRDEQNRWHIPHQILEEYLTREADRNDRQLRSRRKRVAIFFSAGAAVLAMALTVVYWLSQPVPYDDKDSRTALDNAYVQYMRYGQLYSSMLSMLDDDSGFTPDDCRRRFDDLKANEPVNRTTLLILQRLEQGKGEIVSWSGQPLEVENCRELAELPATRASSYLLYIDAYEQVLREESDEVQERFLRALRTVLECHADEAWLLNEIVCEPHKEGMSEELNLADNEAMKEIPAVMMNRSVNYGNNLAKALIYAREQSRQAEDALNSLGIVAVPAPGE